LVEQAGRDDLFPVIENETGKRIGYQLDMKDMNSVRLWCNHGCTMDEVMQQKTINIRTTTIVPESSRVAAMLAEGLEQLG
jgi:Mg2+/Co2+ transporter CorC